MSFAKRLLTTLATAAACSAGAQTAQRFDLLITEIMADPSPTVGLPNAEYIEIKNVSATAWNLQDWRISDATGTAVIRTAFVLQPDSAVILCATSNVALLSPFGRTIGVPSFPSLDNDGELLTLRSPQNRTIHAVHYTSDWYGNEVKREGGWSLEMIDTANPCTARENWKASTSTLGGTPGQPNAVNATNPDGTPPQVKKAFAVDSITVVLRFDEPLDSTSAAVRSHYLVVGNTVLSALPLPPLFQQVQLQLRTPLQPLQVYEIVVSHLTDCKGNAIGAFNKTSVGLAQPAAPMEMIINEVLFNPRPGGYDYVEFFNRSRKTIDASSLLIANRNASGALTTLRKLSAEPFAVFPGDYVVVTEDATSLAKEYLVKHPEAVLVLSSLPTFPDDKGRVVLLNSAGDVIDEVAYDKAWHFALIDNSEGVALERMDPEAPTQNQNNWHSAAATAGYGTPTDQNSQHRLAGAVQGTVTISPAVFSPDGDGRDDIATIHYQLAETGFVTNVSIFDAGGRLVRYLVKNELLSQKGFWKWDGLGEGRNKLPIGTYIIYTEIFNLEGKRKSFKNTIVLARKLN